MELPRPRRLADPSTPDSPMARSRLPFLLPPLALFLLSGCERGGAEPSLAARPPSQTNLKRNVVLAQADKQSLDYYVETVGALEAEAETNLAAGVAGIVDEVRF